MGYRKEGEFPFRPDHMHFHDLDHLTVNEMKTMEHRIKAAIDMGGIINDNGKYVSINDTTGINTLGQIMESSACSPNAHYYGSLHNLAHVMLSKVSDPQGKYGLPPGVMEHFETATRDPAFFRLHKYMDNIFREFKDRLPAYTYDELNFEGVDLVDFSVDGSLETFFEDFEFSLLNAVDDTVEVADVPISAVVRRINHKPFAFNLNVKNNKGEDTEASVRIYMCPRYDNNHVAFSLNEGRYHCFELDKFWTKLTPGDNTVVHKSSESSVTVPDSVSFATLIEKADSAVAAGQEASGMEAYSRNCGIPDRLLLPKGNERGLEFALYAFVNDGSEDHTETFDLDGHYGGTHAQCGIHGQKYPDLRPMGFPLDRKITDPRMALNISNFKKTYVKVYHKQ